MVEVQKPKKPSAALWWIGILIIIVGLYLATASIGSSSGVPTNLEIASFICGASLLAGMVPIGYYLVLETKHSGVIEKQTEAIVIKHGIDFPPKVSIILLRVSCCIILGSIFANMLEYLGDTESGFLFFSGMILLIYYLVLVIKRENRVKGLSEEM